MFLFAGFYQGWGRGWGGLVACVVPGSLGKKGRHQTGPRQKVFCNFDHERPGWLEYLPFLLDRALELHQVGVSGLSQIPMSVFWAHICVIQTQSVLTPLAHTAVTCRRGSVGNGRVCTGKLHLHLSVAGHTCICVELIHLPLSSRMKSY